MICHCDMKLIQAIWGVLLNDDEFHFGILSWKNFTDFGGLNIKYFCVCEPDEVVCIIFSIVCIIMLMKFC